MYRGSFIVLRFMIVSDIRLWIKACAIHASNGMRQTSETEDQ